MHTLEPLKKLYERLILILSYKNDAKNLASARNRHLHQLLNDPDNPLPKDSFISGMNFFYGDPLTGNKIFYGAIKKDVEKEIQSLQLHQNKQYQWLLAEAYEEYEDFLELIYATAAFLDPNFWPLSHYGNNRLEDLKGRTLEWYLSIVKNSANRITPEKILANFRKYLPEFEEAERNNKCGYDLRFRIALITQTRHHIVHTGGTVGNREAFSEKIINASIRPSEDKVAELRYEINSLFGLIPPYDNIITLLEQEIDSESRIPIYHDVMENYCRDLLSSAHLITYSLKVHLERLKDAG